MATTYDLKQQHLDKIRAFYDERGAAFILVKGLTPIPFKLVTIVSGVLGYNFPLFVVLALITRGGRFFILAGILNRFGDKIRFYLERHFALFILISLAIIVGGFWLASRMF